MPMSVSSETPVETTRLLSGIHSPVDVKALPEESLPQLAQEVRDELIKVLSQTGGHLGPNLGVVELTIALHRVFTTPHDRFVFDVVVIRVTSTKCLLAGSIAFTRCGNTRGSTVSSSAAKASTILTAQVTLAPPCRPASVWRLDAIC